jgi:hypothetical protein
LSPLLSPIPIPIPIPVLSHLEGSAIESRFPCPMPLKVKVFELDTFPAHTVEVLGTYGRGFETNKWWGKGGSRQKKKGYMGQIYVFGRKKTTVILLYCIPYTTPYYLQPKLALVVDAVTFVEAHFVLPPAPGPRWH